MESFILFSELIGTVGFAISGAMLAIKKDFDIFGIVIMGIIAAVGGGFMRDIIIGVHPPVMFSNPIYCITASLTSLLICVPIVRRFLNNKNIYFITMIWMDSIGLSVFTATGVISAAAVYPDNYFLLFFVGVITGVGGGVIRDVLACEKPYIFTKHIYACASSIGALLCVYLKDLVSYEFAALVCSTTIISVRLISAYFHLKLPHINND